MAENEVEQTSPEPSVHKLDTIISDAIKEHSPPVATEIEGQVLEVRPDAKAEIPTPTESFLRERDEKGRFAPNKDSVAAKAPDKGTAEVAAKTADATATQPVQEQPLEAPARWSEAAKATFSKLPRDAQQVILERNKDMEADYTRKTQEVAETRKTYEPVVQELTRWDPYLKQIGVKPHEAIGQMLNVEYNLRTGTPEQKTQALAYLAQLYGIPNPQTGETSPVDPVTSQLSRQVASLTQQLNQFQTNAVQSERQRAQAEFDALGIAKDQNGALKYPHFDRVNKSMIHMVATGQADSWDVAYSKSVRLDDELYNQNIEAERKRVSDELEKQRLEAVEKAKGAKPVKTSNSMPKGSTNGKGLDAIISDAMSKGGM